MEFKQKYEKLKEDINVPIKIGDTILGGRFKNKRLRVKKIGKKNVLIFDIKNLFPKHSNFSL